MNNKRIENLTYLRGVATLVVMLFHVTTIYDDKYLGGIFTPGWSGVEMFFVLSGFLMIYTYSSNISTKEFVRKRLIRIIPAYWIYTIMVFAIQYVMFKLKNFCFIGWVYQEGMSLKQMLPKLISALLFDPISKSFLLPTAWTLSYEILFYVICIILFFRGKKAFYGIVSVWTIGSILNIVSGFNNDILGFVFSQYTLEFVAGIVIAEIVIAKKYTRESGVITTVVGIILLTISWVLSMVNLVDTQLYRVYCFGIPCVLLLYGITVLEKTSEYDRRDSAVKKCLRYFSNISYTLYLVHYVVAWFIFRTFFDTNNPLFISAYKYAKELPTSVVILANVGIVIFISHILYKKVESAVPRLLSKKSEH